MILDNVRTHDISILDDARNHVIVILPYLIMIDDTHDIRYYHDIRCYHDTIIRYYDR